MTLALKYGGFNIHNDVKEKLAVSSTVYITIHDFIVTAQQQPQPHAVGMRLPPPLTHHHSIACYKKTLSAYCLWMRWAGIYPITDFLTDAGHKWTDNKTGILEHDIGTISAFNVL